jgi:alginate O-acetyltransferase complex protein AlgI
VGSVLLVLLNIAVAAWLCGSPTSLAVYLALGFACARLASGRGPRIAAVAIAAWTGLWILVKPAGPGGVDLVGSSYVYLKVFDLIARAAKGGPPPGPLDFILQMTFFPSFLAGPVAGPEPFARRVPPGVPLVGEAAARALRGVVKLWVLVPLVEPANLLAAPDAVSLLPRLGRGDVWLCAYASAFSLYWNFSGYTDLAIALGLLMGVRLPENFASPYLSASPSEFWQRWHMSFTAWLRAHVFDPTSRLLVRAGGGGLGPLAVATAATMLFCAAWHRFSTALLAWGLYHAALVVAHQVWATTVRPRFARAGLAAVFGSATYRGAAVLATFHAVLVGWVLFLPLDAPLADHLAILRRLFA